MKLSKARRLAINLMYKFGLHDWTEEWTFEFDNAKRRFGCCKISKRKITLSRHLVKINDREKVEDTIRHEIAHALDFLDRGKSDHSDKWKAWAIKCGAKPERGFKRGDVNGLDHKYFYYCPSCGHAIGRHRRVSRKRLASCNNCVSGGFNLDKLIIPNVPAKELEAIEAGERQWPELPESGKLIEKLKKSTSRANLEENALYREYREYHSEPVTN